MTDVVVIRFTRNATTRVRFIRAFRVLGTASPCAGFIALGRRVLPAERCLLNNGFRLIFSRNNVLIFVRNR
jgi:hypothetical protein